MKEVKYSTVEILKGINEGDDRVLRFIYKSYYEIVEKMPVWPFDFKSIRRFISTIALPLIIFLINQLTSSDSVFYQFFKLLKSTF